MLDLGVMGIIAPMINTKEDCENFVSTAIILLLVKVWSMRAQLIYGQDYFNKANENVMSFAMIETK